MPIASKYRISNIGYRILDVVFLKKVQIFCRTSLASTGAEHYIWALIEGIQEQAK
jgi:hypothetical protein